MKIEHNVPVPVQRRVGRPRLYHFEEMLVGDCATINASYNTIYGSLQRFLKKEEFAGWDFVLAKHGEKRVRVWRKS